MQNEIIQLIINGNPNYPAYKKLVINLQIYKLKIIFSKFINHFYGSIIYAFIHIDKIIKLTQ